jgi:folylpolyglutamate synthase/dihydropteroate synthase
MRQHTYSQAERFILSREYFGMKLGLENITEFLHSLGDPQSQYGTIHVSGTNGKGSTSAMIEAALRAQGYKTGLYTSPHLVDLRERIKVNGRKISEKAVTAFVDQHRATLVKKKSHFLK